MSHNFAVEANPNESLHGVGHSQNIRDAIVVGVQHVLVQVHVNCVGQASADDLGKWHWRRFDCWLQWLICAIGVGSAWLDLESRLFRRFRVAIGMSPSSARLPSSVELAATGY